MPFRTPAQPELRTLLIAFTDLEGFTAITRKQDSQSTFCLMNAINRLIVDTIEPANGCFIKNLGDGSLLVFDLADTDAGVRSLLACKQLVENHLHTQGISSKLRITAHVGEALVGPSQPYGLLDVFGETVNRAAILGSGAYRGELVISTETFRKLLPESRKLFARHIKEVVYRASVREG